MRAYMAVLKRSGQGGVKLMDFSTILSKMQQLRTDKQCRAIGGVLKVASHPLRSPIGWKKMGLIYTAALLEPVCANITKIFVDDFEEMLKNNRQVPDNNRPTRKWHGDLWEFVLWAEENLPEFDPYQREIDFLPSVATEVQ